MFADSEPTFIIYISRYVVIFGKRATNPYVVVENRRIAWTSKLFVWIFRVANAINPFENISRSPYAYESRKGKSVILPRLNFAVEHLPSDCELSLCVCAAYFLRLTDKILVLFPLDRSSFPGAPHSRPFVSIRTTDHICSVSNDNLHSETFFDVKTNGGEGNRD